MVPLPSVCFASTTRNVPGSCTVQRERDPAWRARTPVGAGDVAEREVGVGDVDARSTVRRAAVRGRASARRRHDGAEHATEHAVPDREREQEDNEDTPRHAREATGMRESYSRAGPRRLTEGVG